MGLCVQSKIDSDKQFYAANTFSAAQREILEHCVAIQVYALQPPEVLLVKDDKPKMNFNQLFHGWTITKQHNLLSESVRQELLQSIDASVKEATPDNRFGMACFTPLYGMRVFASDSKADFLLSLDSHTMTVYADKETPTSLTIAPSAKDLFSNLLKKDAACTEE